MLLAPSSRIDHAWHIVAAGFVISLMTTGIRFAAGPFMSSIMADFSLTHTQFSTIVAVSLLVYGLCMPVAGRITDLFGGRLVLSAGGALLSGSLAISAWTTSATAFTLFFAFFASLGFAAAGHVSLSAIIGRWFVRHRGLAMTLISSGSMSGLAFMVPLSAALIHSVGWRWTMTLFALAILVVTQVAALAVGKSSPEATTDGQEGPTARQPGSSWRTALRSRPFWLLTLGFFACGFSMNVLGTHGVPMLEHHGFSTMTAAYGIGLIGLVSIFSTAVLGAASDRLGRQNILALIYAVRGIGFLGLLVAGQQWELYAVAAIGGLVWSGSSGMTSALTADLYGVRSVGTLFGLIFLSHQIGAAAGSYLGGWGFDTFGSYNLTFLITAALLLNAALLSYRLPDRRAILARTQVAAAD